MDVRKVVGYLMSHEYGDPFTDPTVKWLHVRLEKEKSGIGKLIRRLLNEAEKGRFK